MLKFLGFFLSTIYGMDSAKKPSHATAPLNQAEKLATK
jgi:hypothetical protein